MAYDPTAIPTRDTIAILGAMVNRPPSVYVAGFYAPGDLGSGTFGWYPGDSTTPVVGMVINPSSGVAGRFKRQFSGAPSVRMTGAKGDGTANDRAAFAASDSFSFNTYVPAGTYRISSNITLSNQIIFAEGAIIKPDSGVTVTLNGPISAGLWQIFDLTAAGLVVLGCVSEIQGRWFGMSPSASAAVNAAAWNAAIVCANASHNANLLLGPDTLSINATINYSGGRGITTVGIYDGSQSAGSTAGNCVVKWTGGASPMILTTDTFNTFNGFSLQNNGSATHGIKCNVGGRNWFDHLSFAQPSGAVAFSVSSIEIDGVNWDRIRYCDFGAGPAILFTGLGTTLEIDKFMFDSTVGSGAYITAGSGGTLDVMTIRNGTVNYQTGTLMLSMLDMTGIGSGAVSVIHAENIEYDAATTVQTWIAQLKNCRQFVFGPNQITGFGGAWNTESPITALNSRVVPRNVVGFSLQQPLVHTLDSTSYVYPYESYMELGNTAGLATSDSQSGNLINAPIDGSNGVIIQGDRASAMSDATFLATLTSTSVNYTTAIAVEGASANKGFITVGQRFTIEYYNNSGGDLGRILFSSDFVLSNPSFAPPPNGLRASINFQWDGTKAREKYRQVDANPLWVSKTSTGSVTLTQRRIAADATGGDITLTLPRVDQALVGARFFIKKITAANNVILNVSAGDNIDGAGTYTLTAQWSFVEVECNGSFYYVVAAKP